MSLVARSVATIGLRHATHGLKRSAISSRDAMRQNYPPLSIAHENGEDQFSTKILPLQQVLLRSKYDCGYRVDSEVAEV